jgi:predicted transcriptional regulator
LTRRNKILVVAGTIAVLALGGTAAAAAASPGSSGGDPTVQTQAHSKRWHGNPWTHNAALLSLLKTDAASLQIELKAGKSLADVAAEKGVSEQSVIDLLVQQRTQQIQQMATNGKITQDKASQLIANVPANVKKLVERKGWPGGRRHGKKPGGAMLQTVASVLGMTPQDLITQLKTGKSIAQIAQSKGISEQTVINALVKQDTARITQWVESTHAGNH